MKSNLSTMPAAPDQHDPDRVAAQRRRALRLALVLGAVALAIYLADHPPKQVPTAPNRIAHIADWHYFPVGQCNDEDDREEPGRKAPDSEEGDRRFGARKRRARP